MDVDRFKFWAYLTNGRGLGGMSLDVRRNNVLSRICWRDKSWVSFKHLKCQFLSNNHLHLYSCLKKYKGFGSCKLNNQSNNKLLCYWETVACQECSVYNVHFFFHLIFRSALSGVVASLFYRWRGEYKSLKVTETVSNPKISWSRDLKG